MISIYIKIFKMVVNKDQNVNNTFIIWPFEIDCLQIFVDELKAPDNIFNLWLKLKKGMVSWHSWGFYFRELGDRHRVDYKKLNINHWAIPHYALFHYIQDYKKKKKNHEQNLKLNKCFSTLKFCYQLYYK